MEPKISVLMGIYNCADTLEKSLDSLLNQTYQNFECNDIGLRCLDCECNSLSE